MNFCKKQKKVQRTESRVLINIELVKSPWHPFSPEGCTIITPGDRSPEGEGTGGRCAPPKSAPGGRHNPNGLMSKSFYMGLTDTNQLLLQWRPPGAGFGGAVPTPGLRRTPCSSPGVILVWPFGPGTSPQKVSVILKVIASKVKQSQRNFREIEFSQVTSYCSRTRSCKGYFIHLE